MRWKRFDDIWSGSLLRIARLENTVTAAGLASVLGVHPDSVRRIERRERLPMHLVVRYLIAVGLAASAQPPRAAAPETGTAGESKSRGRSKEVRRVLDVRPTIEV